MASASQPKSTLKSDSEGYTRLHITPFDADLLKVVVPAGVLPQARSISYHTLQTFPDKRYGFIELPTEDAEKLRKKLNGATLKGTKVRIEQARPEAIPQPADTMGGAEVEVRKAKKEKKSRDKSEKSKKRKLEPEVVEGVVIEDRKIKRGWTVTESDKIQEKRKHKSDREAEKEGKKEKKLKKREVKSKYTEAPECLFKQKISEVRSGEAPKQQKDDGDEEPRRKKRKGDKLLVVHEFEKTHKYPTFLKDTAEKAAPEPLTFEDGKGWLDSEGNVVENAKSRRPSFSKVKAPKKQPSKPAPVEDDDTSSSGASSESDSDDEVEVPAESVSPTKDIRKPVSTPEYDDDTSSSGSSSEDESPMKASAAVKTKSTSKAVSMPKAPLKIDEDSSSRGSSSDEETDPEDEKLATPETSRDNSKKLKLDTQTPTSPASALKNDSSRPKSSGSATSLTIKIPSIAQAPTEVHPLEALYKRPAGTEAPAGESFSFFGNNDDIEEEDGPNAAAPSGSQVPMTPFSKQDYDFRNIRSAAPTPDTAHPSRSYNLWPRQGSGEETLEEEEEGDGEDATMTGVAEPQGDDKTGPKSDFQDWFWEHRGDLNRSWKKRRKTASKEKRNRENRARAARAI